MPNWCNNQSVILSHEKDNKNLKKVYDVINSIANDRTKSVVDLFYELTDVKEDNDLYSAGFIRGDINYVELRKTKDGEPYIEMNWDTAWQPMIEGLDYILEPLGLYEFTIAEEPSNLVYINNDELGEFFPNKFVIDGFDEENDDYVGDYFTSLDEALKWLSNFFKKEIKTLEEAEALCNEYNSTHEEGYITINEFTLE